MPTDAMIEAGAKALQEISGKAGIIKPRWAFYSEAKAALVAAEQAAGCPALNPPKAYRKHAQPAREMTDEQIAAEITELEAKWDDFRANCEGHSGSPGEWIVERLDELDTAQKRRAHFRPLPTPGEQG